MDKIAFDKIDEIINEQGFAIVNGMIDGYQIDEVTKEFLHETSTTLIPGFGLPNNFVIEHPPEEKEGTILVYKNKAWVHDETLFESRRIGMLEKARGELLEELNRRVTYLERKKAAGRASEAEEARLTEWTNMLFDVEELDLTDPKVTLPVLA